MNLQEVFYTELEAWGSGVWLYSGNILLLRQSWVDVQDCGLDYMIFYPDKA